MVYNYEEYEWGGKKYSVPAKEVANLCREIEEQEGCVTKQNLLERAREEDCIIHNCIEWNNEVAGEKYRLHQCGVMLSSLKVKITGQTTQEPKTFRLYVNTNENPTAGEFRNILTVKDDAELYASTLSRARMELKWFVEKYNTLKELSGIIEPIKDYLEKVDL